MSLEDSVKLCSDLLEFFEEQDIQVIRLGLHAQESLQQGYLAGPYHRHSGSCVRAGST